MRSSQTERQSRDGFIFKMSKYANNCEKIRIAEALPHKEVQFDHRALTPKSATKRWLGRQQVAFVRTLLLPFFRQFRPTARFANLRWIVRHDDVLTALKNPKAFAVPFEREMIVMAGGTNFALGEDGELHDRQRRIMLAAREGLDIENHVLKPTREVADALLRDSGGKINVAEDFFGRIGAEVAIRLFDLKTDSAVEFGRCAMAAGALLFADPYGEPKAREQALLAAKRLRRILTDSIISCWADGVKKNQPNAKDSILLRTIEMVRRELPSSAKGPRGKAKPKPLTDEQLGEVRAIIFGLITGFVPTNVLAAGRFLSFFQDEPTRLREAIKLAGSTEAVRSSSQKTDVYEKRRRNLRNYIWEMLRHRPVLFPGQFRIRTDEPLPVGASRHLKRIKTGEPVLVSTASAMHDPRAVPNPSTFDPERNNNVSHLLFGAGMHECTGTHMAIDVLTESLQLLLSRRNIRFEKPRKPIELAGPFPDRLMMVFDPQSGHRQRNTITAALPLRDANQADELKAKIRQLHADTNLRESLTDTGIIHFCALNVVDLGPEASTHPHLLFEFNVDGPRYDAIDTIFNTAGQQWLDPLSEYVRRPFSRFYRLKGRLGFEHAQKAGAVNLRALLKQYSVEFHRWPWGNIGLNFMGAGEYSAEQIDREADLFDFIKNKATQSLDRGFVLDPPNKVINDCRAQVSDSEFRDMLIRPEGSRPRFTDYDHKTFEQATLSFLTPPWVGKTAFGFGLISLVILITAIFCAAVGLHHYVSFWAVPLLLSITVVAALLKRLRQHEEKDEPDNTRASLKHMQQLKEMEDLPGHVQNHLLSVSTIKPGFFRKLTFGFSLKIIEAMAVHWFRPGNVVDFATIHCIKWFRLSGTSQLMFQANYDGSWESYLEDFVSKAHAGQTITWNNCKGFPKTNWFFRDGAEDGDRFKRWVRTQQVETLFWYSRRPDLTIDLMRRNAMVRDGLARARTSSEYRAWASLFGSVPRHQDAIETHEVQTLLLRALGRHRFGVCHLLSIKDPDKARQFIENLLNTAKNSESAAQFENTDAALYFGDALPRGKACFIGLSSHGLQKLGMDAEDDETGLGTFPAAFVDGMANRSRVLGDIMPLQWSDMKIEQHEKAAAQEKHQPFVCDIVLLTYATKRSDLNEADMRLKTGFTKHDLSIGHEIDISRFDEKEKHLETLGFRDGFGQPVMRGTQTFAELKDKQNLHNRDIVGPGEFVLGYQDTRGYIPVSPTISVNDPRAHFLAPENVALPGQLPKFDNRLLSMKRDIGRNGSFLAIRQLEHDQDAFDCFTARAAKRHIEKHSEEVNQQATGAGLVVDPTAQPSTQSGNQTRSESPKDGLDSKPTDDPREQMVQRLFAAKLIGRWQDGSSLTRNPVVSETTARRTRFFKFVRKFASELDDDEIAKFPTPANKLAEYKALDQPNMIWSDQDFDTLVLVARSIAQIRPDACFPFELTEMIVPDNDFLHGTDDPEGLYCPLGSHIRRANPRDSLSPGSVTQLEINNRHRLLRRGRPYKTNTDGKPSYGTLFMCFNADIERQFEFVQQTWLNARSFHGIGNLPDPIITPKQQGDRFTIPLSEGVASIDYADESEKGLKNFVTAVGGGYFFFPGRRALRFLSSKP